MPKRGFFQGNVAQLSSSENKNSKRRRTKKNEIEWLALLRFSIILFLAGVIVFNYYLVTENQLGSFYVTFWDRHKEALSPILVFSGYTLAVFLIGYQFGKRR